MDEFLTARRLRPNDEEVTRLIGHIRRRQGKWPEAIEAYKAAAELDPRSHLAWFNLADAYVFTRDYATAKRELETTITLAPDFFDAYLQQAHVAIKSQGNAAEARRILDAAAERIPPNKWRPLYGFWLFGMGRIADISDMGQQTRAVVDFNQAGRKTLILQYARLEAVG